MKIRTDFVTNSSSTSFILIVKEEINKKNFLELMGVTAESPLLPIFESLYNKIVENMLPISEQKRYWEYAEGKELEDLLKADFSEQMTRRLAKAKGEGKKIYVGELSSEDEIIEGFFCCETFEVENEKIYFNGLECVW